MSLSMRPVPPTPRPFEAPRAAIRACSSFATARLRRSLALCLAVLVTPAFAQSGNILPGLEAARPDATTTTSPAPALPAPGSADLVATPADLQAARDIWRRANERVAEFPRGHIDLLRWEAANPASAVPAPEGTAPTERPLGVIEAVRQSLQHRPDLFTRHVRNMQRAWIDAVAARQAARNASEVLHAARVGTELGRRMVAAGNWSHVKFMNERLTEAQAWQAAANAQVSAHAAAEHLAGLMGVWDAAGVAALLQRLPGMTEAGIEAAALRGQPLLAQDLVNAQRQITALSAGRWEAWLRATDTAVQALPEPGGDGPATPPHLSDLTVINDHALERAVKAHAALLDTAAKRRSMARQAWAQVRLRHASALHAQNVVAQLQTVREQETLLRYNGMLQSSWELLASARDRIGALDGALMARRDYWRAHSDWQALLAGADYDGPDAPAAAAGGAAAAAPH
ncbi:MAG: hypothetical protein MUF76_15765 [Hydrogenophaga sp.]|nr:hypothetical protein [Hydrogenophaga sp.]